ncbi:Muscle, skeletal receptor tyrosine protein kinase [Larimichthys crocea]|uniref:Uncharacterized protein n=1 Tax=Larimichthys crocea TaxID=215358 RepID=A0ACD3QPX6_LARCR|nr:Muscle, skeletal receptor tyrosine protein kinase [Larimichthys crocea]
MKAVETISVFLLVLVTSSYGKAPRIITLLETVDVLLDHNATFICEVDSRPSAEITWMKNNNPIMYYDSRYITKEQGTNANHPSWPQIKRHPTNVTLLLESKASLPCVTLGNPKPDVTWLKDDELIKVSDRVTILDYGTLKIHNLQKEDAGQYRCVARNSFGLAFSKPVTIEVQAPARILRVPKEKRVAYGSQISLECNATGNPIPTITWLENGNTISGASVEETLAGEYFQNTHPLKVQLGPGNIITAEGQCHVSSVCVVGLYKGVAGYCSAYRGDVCRTILRDDLLVFFNSSLSDPEDMQEYLVQSFWTELEGLSMLCSPAVRSLLCHSSFPDCNPSGLGPAPKPVCREHCLAVKELYCHKEWLVLEGSSSVQPGIFSSATGSHTPSSLLPNCQALPSLHTDPDACTHVPFVDINRDQITTTCYNDRGRFYQGSMNVTRSGIPCQSWSQQVPHQHRLSVEVIPELKNSENYCRNPGGISDRPWCYTLNPNIRWEYCDVPQCGEATMVSVIKPESPGPRQTPRLPPTVTLSSPAYSMSVIVIILTCTRSYSLLHHHHPCLPQTEKAVEKPEESSCWIDSTPTPCIQRVPLLLNSKLLALEYPRNNIQYVRDIGEGAFGRVFQARAPGLLPMESFTMVAVKMLKEEASADMQNDFQREAALMAQFDHPNIVRLLGVCAVGKPMCLMFRSTWPMVTSTEFLRRRSPTQSVRTLSRASLSGRSFSSELEAGLLSCTEQLSISKQIACRNGVPIRTQVRPS